MKVAILDKTVNSLKLTEKCQLFGTRDNDKVVVSSLKMRKGLEQVGAFYQNKEDYDGDANNSFLLFSLNNEILVCSYVNDDRTSENVELNIINYSTDFGNRIQGVVDPSVLQGRTVTIIGLGSGGAVTAEDLVRSGVGNLNLVDFDTVSASNICRSIYDLTDIGEKKTEALSKKLIRINPDVNINIYDEDVLEMDIKTLRLVIKTSDILIEATDNIKPKRYINGLAFNTTIVLYPAVYDKGKGGDILFTVPGATPCFECVFKSIYEEMKDVKRSEWEYSSDGTKPISMSGLISDIKIVASRSVKLALAFLTGDQDNSFLEKVTEHGCTMLFIGNESGFSIFDKPFQEVWAETEINPECFCQTLGRSICESPKETAILSG
jgi:molybdopterin/thiamine biosynthesis adenylyltransferase